MPVEVHDLRSIPGTPLLSGIDASSVVSSVLQPGMLRQMNEQATLRTIRQMGALSRTEIARHLGTTAPTASKAVDALIQRGWLIEQNSAIVDPDAGRGRPGKKVDLVPASAGQVLGAVVDAKRCRVVASGLNGVIQDDVTITFLTPRTYDQLIDRIMAAVTQLANRPGIRTFGLGISLPGLVDRDANEGILSPNLPITNGRSPVADISAQLPYPCVQIQEEHALCLSERAFGAARGLNDFAMIDVSTGVGLGIVLGGRLVSGHRGLAGELGHITAIAEGGRLCGCGNFGCLETEASDTALAQAISDRWQRPVSWEELPVLIQSDLAPIDDVVDRCVRFLAIGVATVINLFNISTLFVHGEMFTVFPDLFARLLDETKRRALAPSFADCNIIRTRGSKRLGAIAGILEHLTDSLAPIDFSPSGQN